MLINADAQILKKVTDAGTTVNEANNVMASTSGAITNAKNTFNTILGGGKSKEANIFVIAGIEYGNEDLELLKNDIKNTKGVKDVVTNFKDGTITIMVKCKINATGLWDKIPQSEKSKFKLVQSDEKSILLEYKVKEADQSNTGTAKKTPENSSFSANKSDLQSSSGNNSSQAEKNSLSPDISNKTSYFIQYDFKGKSVYLEREKLDKEACSASLGPTGKTLTVTFYDLKTKTGISFAIVDILEMIREKKYEFDSKKTNQEKATYENGTSTKQLNVVFQPGDDKRYQIQCSTDPVMNYQGSGYLTLTKFKPVKGSIVEGEFGFSFPVYKTKDGPAEIQQMNSGKFRIAIQ